ncbi:MAG: hypothetical protein HOI95_20070 [Chromatiales bacterium]|nr:hypothetical protein [Chromatiales bacterium]
MRRSRGAGKFAKLIVIVLLIAGLRFALSVVEALVYAREQMSRGLKRKVSQSAFGVRLLQPVTPYRQVQRAIKYGLLFPVFTFGFVFVVEVLARNSIHIMQYATLGVPLCLFFLLLLAFAEHTGFAEAYTAGAASVLILLGHYIQALLRNWMQTTGCRQPSSVGCWAPLAVSIGIGQGRPTTLHYQTIERIMLHSIRSISGIGMVIRGVAFLVASPVSMASTQLTVLETKGVVTEVHLHRRTGTVTREVRVDAPAGEFEVVVTGLPRTLVAGSLWVAPVAGLDVLNVHEATKDKDAVAAGGHILTTEVETMLRRNRWRNAAIAGQGEYLSELQQYTARSAGRDLVDGILSTANKIMEFVNQMTNRIVS